MEFENLFLLDLLLLKNPDILNYSFSKKLIREIVKAAQLVKNKIVLNFYEKIILDMINYYLFFLFNKYNLLILIKYINE
jgi:hypothetical protein